MLLPPDPPRAALLSIVAILIAGCTATSPPIDANGETDVAAFVAETSASSVLGPDARFIGSTYADVGSSGLFPVRTPDECEIAVLHGREDSLAVRLAALKQARK